MIQYFPSIYVYGINVYVNVYVCVSGKVILFFCWNGSYQINLLPLMQFCRELSVGIVCICMNKYVHIVAIVINIILSIA